MCLEYFQRFYFGQKREEKDAKKIKLYSRFFNSKNLFTGRPPANKSACCGALIQTLSETSFGAKNVRKKLDFDSVKPHRVKCTFFKVWIQNLDSLDALNNF